MAPQNYIAGTDNIALPMKYVFEYLPLRKSGMETDEIPLADQVYEYILRKVVFPEDGDASGVEYGGKITESVIANAMQMSNGPVREAIFRLRQEGWIKTVGNRGSYLVDFSDPEIAREIYKFRLSFETGAFYSLASAATAEQITVLKKLVDSMELAKKQSDASAFRKADVDFHLAVVEFAGGKMFRQIFRSKLLQWYAMSFQIIMKSMGSEKYRHCLEAPGTSSHYALFDAIDSRNSALAAKLINGHYSYIAHLLGIDKNY